ncbi:hypothetical protein [Sphingomonas sp. BK235]|uniref:hypothetical protein n=1 Tax=Sphingomonas sp. BK235 TaxID=2512131 RepID=UPI00104A2A38|nr:hypothetical protein [Sphingomonas sp. BK235]
MDRVLKVAGIALFVISVAACKEQQAERRIRGAELDKLIRGNTIVPDAPGASGTTYQQDGTYLLFPRDLAVGEIPGRYVIESDLFCSGTKKLECDTVYEIGRGLYIRRPYDFAGSSQRFRVMRRK